MAVANTTFYRETKNEALGGFEPQPPVCGGRKYGVVKIPESQYSEHD